MTLLEMFRPSYTLPPLVFDCMATLAEVFAPADTPSPGIWKVLPAIDWLVPNEKLIPMFWRVSAGATVAASELLRVPCDLDLADAGDREEAERLYLEQVTTLRDALVGADMVLELWRQPLTELTGTVAVDHSIELAVRLPAPRLVPTAFVAPERRLVVTPVCAARTLAEGRPQLGIACSQQDLTRVYPLADDPERCVEDFLQQAAQHARALAERMEHQEASVERFLELSGEDFPAAG